MKSRVQHFALPGWPDLLVAVALLLVGLQGTWVATVEQQGPPPPGVVPYPDVYAYLLVVAAVAPVVLWRRLPITALGAAAGAIALYLALGYAIGPILLAGPVAVYGVALRRPTARAVAGGLGALLLVLAAAAVRVPAGQWEPTLVVTVVAGGVVATGVPLLAGTVVRIRREARAEVRAEQARRHESEERLQFAQEVHDTVGHGLAVIAMQAGAALHVLDTEPSRARTAMEAVRAISKQSLNELRTHLDTWQGADARPAPRAPASEPGNLDRLVQRVRDAGLHVELHVEPDALDAPTEARGVAYRVVQEALTNVLRHAGAGASATVEVRSVPEELRIAVRDTGTGPAPGFVEGYGLRGMRARVQALGGWLDAGAGRHGGFTVHAGLPRTDGAP